MKTEEEKLRKAYKSHVFPDEQAAERILFLSSTMIHLWNQAIVEAERWLDTKERRVSAYSFNYWLTSKRKESITLNNGTTIALSDISVDLEREVLRKLAGSYQSYFNLKKNKDARARKPRSKEEEWFQTLSWSSFAISAGVLYLPGYQNERIALEVDDYLSKCIEGKETVQATLSRTRDGDFTLSLVIAYPRPPIKEEPEFFRAIDLGAGDIAVSDSDGVEFLIPARRPDKHWRRKVRQIEARVEERVKGSRGYTRLMKARRTVFERSLHQHTSYQRKLAHALCELKVECIIIGKPHTRLGLSKSEGAPDQHWGAQNTGYLFRQLLYIKEKAAERGIKLLEFSDPHREGKLENPQNKFAASRKLLAKGLEKRTLTMPASFTKRHFHFKQ